MRRAMLVTGLVLVSGCGGDGRRDAVAAAEAWLEAVEARDTDTACALMNPSATAAIRKKYAPSGEKGNCANVVRIYHDAFDDGVLQTIIEGGLESEGAVKEDEIGVFPVSGQREFEVILMRRVGDEWKVASTTIGPDPSRRRPAPSPSPAGDQS